MTQQTPTDDRPDAPALGHQFVSTLSAHGAMQRAALVEQVVAEHHSDLDPDEAGRQIDQMVDERLLHRDGDDIGLVPNAGGDE